jgi:translocation and assembly module TamA
VRKGVKAVWVAALAGVAVLPGVACAQIDQPGRPGQAAPAPAPPETPTAEDEIVPDAEFEASMPKIGDDIDAPLDPMAELPPARGVVAGASETLTSWLTNQFEPIVADEPELAEPLPALADYQADPNLEIADRRSLLHHAHRGAGGDRADRPI